MACTHPVTLLSGPNRWMVVPCGKCLQCRIAHSREWATRILHEMDSWNDSSFVTLTYNPENEPKDKSLRKRDLQLYFKRLRKEKKIKYFACGEYGPSTMRPHYHAIIFGVSPKDKNVLNDCWGMGFIAAGNVTYESARYVAQYVDKKYYGDKQKQVYGDKEPPFQLQSQKIGLDYALTHEAQIHENLGLTINGNHVSIPRYYLKHIELSESEREQMQVRSLAKQVERSLRSKDRRSEWMDEQKRIMDERYQSEKNLRARLNLRERKL